MWVVQVNMLIWFPANLAVTVDDPILNLIIPSASLSQVSSSCTTPLYQRSAVYATCDFVGGGTAITGVDVTTLVTFTSSSALVALVNNYVQVCGSGCLWCFSAWHRRDAICCSNMLEDLGQEQM
jgi:hypothetical protein